MGVGGVGDWVGVSEEGGWVLAVNPFKTRANTKTSKFAWKSFKNQSNEKYENLKFLLQTTT